MLEQVAHPTWVRCHALAGQLASAAKSVKQIKKHQRPAWVQCLDMGACLRACAKLQTAGCFCFWRARQVLIWPALHLLAAANSCGTCVHTWGVRMGCAAPYTAACTAAMNLAISRPARHMRVHVCVCACVCLYLCVKVCVCVCVCICVCARVHGRELGQPHLLQKHVQNLRTCTGDWVCMCI